MRGPSFFIDTNIFLRIIVKDDLAKLAECEKIIEKIILGHITAITSSLVLAEVVWTCLKVYKLTKMEVLEVCRGILSLKNIKFEEKQQLPLAMDLYEKWNVKFIDCLIASHPKIILGKTKVVSYDKDFDRLGVKRVEPRQIPA